MPKTQSVLKTIGQTFKIYPLTLLASLGLTVLRVMSLPRYNDPQPLWEHLQLLLTLAIPLTLAITNLNLSQRFSIKNLALASLGTVGLALYVFTLKTKPYGDLQNELTMQLLGLILHLFVAVAPFLRRGQKTGFWEYNKTLFLEFCRASLYAFLIATGLSVASWAGKLLLDFDIPDDIFGYIFVSMGFAHTLIFLAHLPQNFSDYAVPKPYPKILLGLTKFIFLPLLGLYFVLLYTYLIKITVAWQWPNGSVCLWVIGIVVFGFWTILLIDPLKNDSQNLWAKRVHRVFYVAVVPLAILSLLSIFLRVREYGFTEKRYLVLILGIWVLFTSLYFIFSRKKSIWVTPLSLMLFLLFIAFGPWNLARVAEKSQVARLEKILIADGRLVDGRLTEHAEDLQNESATAVADILSYLEVNHDLKSVQKRCSDPEKCKNSTTIAKFLGYLKDDGVEVTTDPNEVLGDSDTAPERDDDYDFNYYIGGDSETLSLENGTAELFIVNYILSDYPNSTYGVQGKLFQIEIANQTLTVSDATHPPLTFALADIHAASQKLVDPNESDPVYHEIDAENWVFLQKNEFFSAEFHVSQFYGRNDPFVCTSIYGQIYVKKLK